MMKCYLKIVKFYTKKLELFHFGKCKYSPQSWMGMSPASATEKRVRATRKENIFLKKKIISIFLKSVRATRTENIF